MKSLWNDLKFKDMMEARVFDKNGILTQLHIGEDLITSAGMAAVADLITEDETNVSGFNWIVIGSGATAASTGDTALEAEIPFRANATGTRVTTSATNDTAQFLYTFSSGNPAGLNGSCTGTQAVEESGVMNELTGGQLLCRQTFPALNIDWDGGDSLQITWKVQIS